MKTLFTLPLFTLSLLALGQTSINQLDTLGKRHGKWQIYLDDRWREVEDSTQAYYSKYAYYDHGKFTHHMFKAKKKWKLEPPEGFIPQKGKPQLLEGTFKRINKKGKVMSIEEFHNGWYTSSKSFYPSGELFATWNNTPQPDTGMPIIYPILNYTKDGQVRDYYYESKHLIGIYYQQQDELLSHPIIGDLYTVYDDNTGKGIWNLAKIVAINQDSLTLAISNKSARKRGALYTDIVNGVTDSPSYFSTNHVIISKTDPKLYWRWVKEVIR